MNRICSIFFSIMLLMLIMPLFIIVAILIKLESKGPILFKQKRVGINEKPFYIYKFRTMYLHKESPSELGPIKNYHALVTKVGVFLRRFKIDELPQLVNILKGDINFIGPRPCLFIKLKNMTAEEKKRFTVLPGITGWAEVNGNLELSWEEQLKLDLWYIDHRSFLLSLKILYRTILTVILGSVKNYSALKEAEDYLK